MEEFAEFDNDLNDDGDATQDDQGLESFQRKMALKEFKKLTDGRF